MRAWCMAALAATLLLVLGCGGRQQTTAAVEQPTLPPTCVEERWEVPPPNIGQTPPRADASGATMLTLADGCAVAAPEAEAP